VRTLRLITLRLLAFASLALAAAGSSSMPEPTASSLLTSDAGAEIAAAEATHKRWFIASVVVAAVGAFGTAWLSFMVWVSGNRLQALAMAQANTRTAEAKRDAAQANSRAAELEHESLELRTRVGAQSEKVARLEDEAAKAQERAALAERHLLELQERVADRTITPALRKILVLLLAKSPGKIEIYCVGGTPEPCNFSNEVQSALREAGWTIGPVSSAMMMIGGTSEGIHVIAHNDRIVRAHVLAKALAHVGFPPRFEVDPTMDEDTVKLSVLPKRH
jgi:hypothetical protein